MTFKQILSHPLFQYLLELFLPLLGYFFFDWSIAVIIAFYFMDYLGSEFARHRRHLKIKTVKNEKTTLFIIGLIISILFFLIALYIGFFSMLVQANYDHKNVNEVIQFLGEEGWLLLPLVIFAAHVKDVMTFYTPRRFLNYNYSKTLQFYFVQITIQFALIVVGLYLWVNFQIHEVLALVIFMLVKVLFDFLIVRKFNEKSKS